MQYTPLEQYGGDTGHTDIRSDIYSLGATLFHLLTLQPPPEAKERFLYPNRLPALRSINPAISVKTEQAVLHALAMHPDDRPKDMKAFRKELLGDHIFINGGVMSGWWGRELQAALNHNKTLVAVVGVLLALAIVITLFAPALPPPS
ncbi:MAG: hypothetical protein D6796_15650 [Caldilineae bacterium]|nr:MAG: hypothetical protein D6796_15650 [Caldilineae bacterium]